MHRTRILADICPMSKHELFMEINFFPILPFPIFSSSHSVACLDHRITYVPDKQKKKKNNEWSSTSASIIAEDERDL